MAQPKFRGRFVWQELMTEDPNAANAFYSKLLGWHTHGSAADPAYLELHAGGHSAVGGILKTPDSAKAMGAKPMWLPYITVDEVDAAVTELQQLGGKVIRPASDIPHVGRFAVVSDPQGAVFAIITPDGPPAPPPAPPQPGEFSWMELATTDHEAAFTFYSKLFGWDAMKRHDMGPMGTYLIFGADNIQRGGIFKAVGPHSHPAWLPYALVADADASAKVVTAAGGHVLNGPMDVPDDGGRIVQLADPTGAMFALHALVKPKAASAPAKPAAPAPAAPAPKATAPKATAPKATAPKGAAPPADKPAPIAAPKTAAPKPSPTAIPASKPVSKVTAAAPKAPATAAAPAKKAPAKKAPAKKTAAKKAAPKKKAAKKAAKKVAKKVARKAAPKKKPAVKKKSLPKAKKKAKAKAKASPARVKSAKRKAKPAKRKK